MGFLSCHREEKKLKEFCFCSKFVIFVLLNDNKLVDGHELHFPK